MRVFFNQTDFPLTFALFGAVRIIDLKNVGLSALSKLKVCTSLIKSSRQWIKTTIFLSLRPPYSKMAGNG